VLATTPGVYAVYDDFELVMQHFCYADKLTLTTQKQDFTQTIYPTDQGGGNFYGKTPVTATSVSTSVAGCTKTYALEIYDNVNKVWVDYNSQAAGIKAASYPYIQNYVAATAVFDILFTSDLGPAWDGKTVSLRIKTTDSYSGDAAGTIYD